MVCGLLLIWKALESGLRNDRIRRAEMTPCRQICIPTTLAALDASPLVPFGGCGDDSIFLSASIEMGLEEKGKQTDISYAPCVKITSVACSGLCLSDSGLLQMET
ncbi:hypothetical protein Q9233_008072 [Columba guinea]|nr:hypothetical protein Q9233_008072 [Columba guinea]